MAWDMGDAATQKVEGDDVNGGMGMEEEESAFTKSLREELVPAVAECGGPTQYTKHVLNTEEKKNQYAKWLWWGMGGFDEEHDKDSEERDPTRVRSNRSEEHDKDTEERDADGEEAKGGRGMHAIDDEE